MEPRQITEDFSVAPQITPEDIPAIAAAGFRSIMCNRPDDEEPDQPHVSAVTEAARAAGLETCCVPFSSATMTEADVAAFRAALDEMPKPMLAYCRTGTRCTMMWSLVNYDTLGAETILRATSAAGYDMSGLLAQLQAR
ncbi:MAG: TIGR01244 family sulfur transferase [Roseovarius sp.]|uniref:TIGR01244 family sulfur transferase n=1 Tax=Roseovarius sp. TaxID=1486281 RepID=UPI0040584085